MLPSIQPNLESSRSDLPSPDGASPVITPHMSFILLLADASAILLSLWLSSCFATWGNASRELLPLVGVCAVALYVAMASHAGLYRSQRVVQIWQEMFGIVQSWVVTAAILSLLAMLTESRLKSGAASIWFFLAPVVLIGLRVVIRSLAGKFHVASKRVRNVAIFGDTPLAHKLLDRIEGSTWMGLRLHGVYDDRKPKESSRRVGSPLAGNMNDLVAAAQRGDVSVIYIALPMHAVERIRSNILALMDTTASVYLIPDFFMFGLIESRISTLCDIPVVTVTESPFIGIEGWTKRAEDIIVGSLIMLLIALPMLLIAIGIKLTSPGPVFFRQLRYGINGKPINVWKFRSMRVTEDGQTSFTQATKGDPRVTRFGAFLRRTSLDELPQFINVIQGSMSIVGPRPHPIALNESFRSLIPGYMLRHKVKPGISGWAQVNGWRGETDTLEKMEKRIEYDLEYIRRWSVWFDLRIIFMTVTKGFSGTNAY